MATIVKLPFKLITVSVEMTMTIGNSTHAESNHEYRVQMPAVDAYLESNGLKDKVFIAIMEDKSFGLRFEHASDAALFKLTML